MVADDKCQALFENCFKLIDGPDAPILTIREYDNKFIFLLSNDPEGNNPNENYREPDGTIPETLDFLKDSVDRFYRFEGYQIFQVIGPEVGANDLDNPDLARMIRQFDIVNFDKSGNPIGTLINWEFDEDMQISVPKVKVIGSNNGIQHSFEVTQDAFATENKQLVNYKNYYFIAIAYAYNQFWPYSIDPNADNGLYGQKLPYLRGRKTGPSQGGKSVVPILGIPHPPTLHLGSATLNCDYGSIPKITRIDGQGNGGIALELTQESIDSILLYNKVRELKYEKNAGPLNIRVIDPLRVKPFDYTLVIKDSIFEKGTLTQTDLNRLDVSNNAYWVLTIDPSVTDDELRDAGLPLDTNKRPIREFRSKTNIGQYYEDIIIPLGISIAISNANFSNIQPQVLQHWNDIMTGYKEITASNIKDRYIDYKVKTLFCQSNKIDVKNDIVFANNGAHWITGLATDNVGLPSKWIRAGTYNLGTWFGNTLQNVREVYALWRLEDAHFPTDKITENKKDAKSDIDRAFKDYTGKFGSLCGGTWAPYVLTSPYDGCPQAKYIEPEPIYNKDKDGNITLGQPAIKYYDFQNLQSFPTQYQPGYNQTMTNLYSVNVVLTPNKDLWTRCVVLESCSDPTKSIGGALKNEPRRSKSVGKDGNPDDSKDGFGDDGSEGMGWFPGYAINIETGERLNIMFSENSDTTLNRFKDMVNGNDMVFNPTSTYALATKDTLVEFAPGFSYLLTAGTEIKQNMYNNLFNEFDNFNGFLQSIGIERIWGGMHYVYVCNSTGNTCAVHYLSSGNATLLATPRRNFNLNNETFKITGTPNPPTHGGFLDADKKYPVFDMGPYDKGEWLVQKFNQFIDKGLGMEVKKYKMQLYNNVMYTYIPMLPEAQELKKEWLSCDVTFKIRVTRPYMRYVSRWYEAPEDRDETVTPPAEYDNLGLPVYKLSTKELAPTINDTRSYQSILDNINIVPNPYYGGSFYERNALDTRVKITNLPTDLKNKAPVTINIFTVNGLLVRTLTKGDSESSYVVWDLKNYSNIPIAGGVYIIHINCPGIGEKILKFFCTMRPTDLNNF
jgi:hypothetical protein